MKLLDLGKMSKVATDGKTTTFRHDDGHEIRILHSALPRIQQEQIKRIEIKEHMADGGEVADDDDSDTPSKESGRNPSSLTKIGDPGS